MKQDRKNEETYLAKEIRAPYTHLIQVQGKCLATKIFWSFNYWFMIPDDVVTQVIDTMTTLVNGIIMIDDIQDNSLIRRGVPTAQCVYGMPLTLNTGLLIINEAMQEILELVPHRLAGKLMADNLHELWVGQGIEIYWRDNFICPTEESYKEMQYKKTGSYIKLGAKLLQVLSENKEDYEYLLKLFGYYSQLRDDYCNLRGGAKEINQENSFCEDLTEGKFTLPIIHASKTPVGDEVLSILRKRTSDITLKKRCMSLLEQAGSLQYTKDKLSELDREARAEVSRLGGNPLLETVLDELSSWRDDKMLL